MSRLRYFFRADGLRGRFQRGISWNVGGALMTHAANFITNVVLANILGREIFGQYSIVQSTLLTFGVIAQAAGGITATKFVAEHRARDKAKAGRVLGLCSATTFVTGTVATLLVFFLAPWLAETVLKSPFLLKPLRIASFVVLLTVVYAFQVGAIAGLESYRSFAMACAFQGPFQLGICALFAWRWGLVGAVTGLAGTALARWLIFRITLHREAGKQGITSRLSEIWQERPILMQYVLPASLSGLTAGPALWFGNTMLVRSSHGYSQMALFSAALNLRSVVMFLPILFNNVGFSLLNNHKNEAGTRYRRIFWANLGGIATAALGGAAVVALLGRHLLTLYGNTFKEGYPVLLVLLCSAVLEATFLGVYVIVQSQEKMWISLLGIVLPRDLTLVIAATFLTARYGALGLALSYVISALVAGSATLFAVGRIGLGPRSRQASAYSTQDSSSRGASTLSPEQI